MNFKVFVFFSFLPFTFSAQAQDTLKVNIQEADGIFLKNNFSLLASSLNIEAQKAQIIQAKAYPNPIFSADVNAYDPGSNKVFHVGPTGEKSFQLGQLILLGGKRKTEIEMAKTNASIAELEFQQLLRQLKFRLHSDLFSVGQMQGLMHLYTAQLLLLENLLSSYETQAHKGNIPLKEVVRLKGAYLKLNNERSELLRSYLETQNSLQILLQTSSVVAFQFTEADLKKYIQFKTIDEIKSEAFANRPELLIIQQNRTLAEQYLKYQKSLAVPDVNLITSYDQRGGAFNDQINIGFSVPLPLWNRNQGNIKTSQFKVNEAGYNLQAIQTEMVSQLQNAFILYKYTVSEYQKATSLYNEDFEITVKGITDNFKKRNVNTVEFIDFFEAYNEGLNELRRIKTKLVVSAEQINLLAGKDIY